jgi:hypothetical protein
VAAADAALIEQLVADFKALQVSYDKFISGLDKQEPRQARDAVKKTLARLMGEKSSNTGQRYRLQALQASLVLHEQHWLRIAREMEEGTFKPDLRRAKLTLGKKAQPAKPAVSPTGSAATASAAATEAVPQTDPGAASVPAAYVEIHRAYLAAQPAGSRPVSLAALVSALTKQSALVRAQYSCREVVFRVDIKDGKPVIKATPKP